MILQLLIVLLALYVGSRYGSLALGAISGIGLAIMVFGFGMKPGNPPTDVIYIIIAAVTCAGMLQASGGMDWLIQLAEKLLRRHPSHVTFLAPLCTFFLTVLVGTGHVVYTLMPIICDIALKKGIRPERPCAVASVASQVGIICSPIAAAVASFVIISNMNNFDINNLQVICITLPASLCGIGMAALFSYKRGKDLDKDPLFQARLKDPAMYEYMYGSTASVLDKKVDRSARIAVFIFVAALGIIMFFSVMQIIGCDIRPTYRTLQIIKGVDDATKFGIGDVTLTAKQILNAKMEMEGCTQYVQKPLAMNLIIQIVMIAAAALMIICAKASPKKAVAGSVWQSGMVAVVAIYGIAWLADTFFAGHVTEMHRILKQIVTDYPWAIAIAFFVVSVLINSQGAVVVAMLPLAYSLDIPGPVLLGVLPSVYGYFFIPNYPSDIATVNFDRSGTTVIGKYLLNHSFMMPGFVSVVVSTLVGLLLTSLFY